MTSVVCLLLSSDGSGFTKSESDGKGDWPRAHQLCPDDPERLKQQQQQLVCGEALTGPCYWEVEWRGELHPAVTDRGIPTSGDDCQCCSVNCSEISSTVRHNVKSSILPVCSCGCDRASSVYVDCSAAALSFYTVSADTLRLLHSFCSTHSHLLHLEPGSDLIFFVPSDVLNSKCF